MTEVPATVVAIDYHGMRLLRFRTVLLDFLRRWGIYVAMGVLLFGAGSNAPVTVAAALAATLLRPLLVASEHGWWIVPATVGYAVAGALPVVLTRPLWWPRAWAMDERALPLEAAVVDRSDRIFGWIVSTPWQAVLLLGAIGLWANGAVPRGPWAGWIALGGYLVAIFTSQRLALLWMRLVRSAADVRSAASSTGRARTDVRATTKVTAIVPIGPRRALVVMPLVRGGATRSRTALIVGVTATCACATARLSFAIPTGWWLAALALIALVATSVLRPCTTRDLQPGWRAHREWPLDVRACERARIAVVLVPALVGIVVAVAIGLATPPLAHVRGLVAYGVVLAAGCGFEAMTPGTMQPTNHAARWVLILAVAIAFGSEVATS